MRRRLMLVSLVAAAAAAFSFPATGAAAGENESFWAGNSFVNQPIPPDAQVDARSAAWITMLAPYVDQISVNHNEWSVAIYHAPAGAPKVPVSIASTNKHIAVPYSTQYRPTPDADAHLAVIDDATGCEYEFQSFDPAKMSALASATYHVYSGSGAHVAGPSHSGGEFSYLAGLITPKDVSSGVIDHALRVALPTNSPAFVDPATRSDGTNPIGVPEGTRIRLNPGLDLAPYHLTPFQAMVAKALQTYGAFDADNADSFALYAESTTDGSAYSLPISSLPKELVQQMNFLAPRPTNSTYDVMNDLSCQQQY